MCIQLHGDQSQYFNVVLPTKTIRVELQLKVVEYGSSSDMFVPTGSVRSILCY
jgi:hypothetical protein